MAVKRPVEVGEQTVSRTINDADGLLPSALGKGMVRSFRALYVANRSARVTIPR
jgi:hypothetical protein